MGKEILQVRVDSADLAVLRDRAAATGKSLAAYIRDLLHDEASRLTNTEVIARIAEDEPVEADLAETRGYADLTLRRRGRTSDHRGPQAAASLEPSVTV